MDLPGEIRTLIYLEVFVSQPTKYQGPKRPGRTKYARAAYCRRRCLDLVQPPLTRVNRKLRAETLPLYYGKNTFELVAKCDPWLLRPRNGHNLLRIVSLFSASAGGGRGTSSLGHLTNLMVRPNWYTAETWGFWMSAECQDGTKERRLLISYPGLDWASQAAVEAAYLCTLDRTRLETPLSSAGGTKRRKNWVRNSYGACRQGVQSMGTLLWKIAQECPLATKWVYMH